MIVIPMAGKSSRFFKEGYNIPKYMLPPNNDSNVFKESIKSFKRYFKTDFFLFITRSDFNVTTFVEKECIALGIINFRNSKFNSRYEGSSRYCENGLEKFKSKK